MIVHLKKHRGERGPRHTNRTSSTYEYHLTSSSGWSEVKLHPHIATSSTYGHWVCVEGISPTADPENLTESDFYALDPRPGNGKWTALPSPACWIIPCGWKIPSQGAGVKYNMIETGA